MATKADYIAMQSRFYNNDRMSVEQIVGMYRYHEEFPYETQLLYEYGDIRKPLFDDLENRKAFDIGCGEGRMIRRMEKLFGKGCDGADLSEKMIEAARERCPQSQLFLSSGDDCGNAPDNSYDFGFCTISLQHIGSYSIRSAILKDLTRIMKPDGKVTLQLIMSEYYPFVKTDHITSWNEVNVRYTRCERHAGYFEDKFDAKGTNSACDAVIGVRDLDDVLEDLGQYFHDPKIWFFDISLARPEFPRPRRRVLPEEHPNSHMHDRYHGTHFVFLHGSGVKK